MSNSAIRQTLEKYLLAMPSNVSTAFENSDFVTSSGVPYQELYTLFAAPENPTAGDGFYRQRGIFQVNLNYPQNKGAGPASVQADAIRDYFHRGLSIAGNGVKVVIDVTPNIGQGQNVGDRYLIVIKITFYADVYA